MNVPLRKMFQRRRIHDDQRRMDDRPGIHQSRRQNIATGFDGSWEPAWLITAIADHALQRKDAGRQTRRACGDEDFRETVPARTSQGNVPVSAKATPRAVPAAFAALAKIREPKVPGGRKTTCPRRRCGAITCARSSCAGRRHRAEDQCPATLERRGDVAGDVAQSGPRASRNNRAPLELEQPSARCCV